MEKQSKTEKIEQELLHEIAEETSKVNGGPSQELVPTTPKMEARLAMIHAGLTEMQAIASERDEATARAEKAEAEIANLINLADQAREGERMRLKEVSDKAITEARAAVAQQEVLQGEIDSLRTRLAACQTAVMEAQAEAAKYKTLAIMVRASVDQILPRSAEVG